MRHKATRLEANFMQKRLTKEAEKSFFMYHNAVELLILLSFFSAYKRNEAFQLSDEFSWKNFPVSGCDRKKEKKKSFVEVEKKLLNLS